MSHSHRWPYDHPGIEYSAIKTLYMGWKNETKICTEPLRNTLFDFHCLLWGNFWQALFEVSLQNYGDHSKVFSIHDDEKALEWKIIVSPKSSITQHRFVVLQSCPCTRGPHGEQLIIILFTHVSCLLTLRLYHRSASLCIYQLFVVVRLHPIRWSCCCCCWYETLNGMLPRVVCQLLVLLTRRVSCLFTF